MQIFMLQGVVIFCIALPGILTAVRGGNSAVEYTYMVYLGLAIWVVGFFFEAVGDYQLDQHITNPASRGTLMTSGLWAYTRHPNYFGEICMWVGVACIAAAHMPSFTLTLLCFASPVLIAYLLTFVSGIPMLEPLMAKKSGWADYASKTPALVPWVGWR
jgi:steroid 5-alpha reductase family enzyme